MRVVLVFFMERLLLNSNIFTSLNGVHKMKWKFVSILVLSYLPIWDSYAQSGKTFLSEHNKDKIVAPSTELILIENARIIDGKGGKPIENGFVLVKNGSIEQVQAGSAPQALKSTSEVINAKGKTIMPGLIDAHMHSVNNHEFLELLLKNGTTSFRDPGHPFSFYQSIHFTQNPLPRIFLTGAHLDYPPVAYGQQALLVKSSNHAREIVESHYKSGATAIKIYFRLPLEFYEGAISAARKNDIPVVAHLELVKATDAIKAGVMGIEHVTSFGTSIAEEEAVKSFIEKVEANNSARGIERYRLWASVNMDSPKVKQAIELAIQHNVSLCPTLAAFEKQAGEGVSDFQVKGFQNMMKFVELAHKMGMKIVGGSHSSSEYSEHGWTYQREMELLEQIGMTPLEVIKASTSEVAVYIKNSHRLGSVEKGKAADLLLIDGNPAVDLKAMYKIEGVLLNGTWVKK